MVLCDFFYVLQACISELARLSGGNRLMLTLFAGAARLSASDNGEDAPTAKDWARVLEDLQARMCSEDLHADLSEYQALPLRAFTLSVKRLPDAAKSVLAVLHLFPHGLPAPLEMVEAIWATTACKDTSGSDGILSALKAAVRANIVQLRRSALPTDGQAQQGAA